MSLNYDLTAIKDRSKNYPSTGGAENPTTVRLIFATMAVDMGAITEKNAAEFYARLRMVSMAENRTTTPMEAIVGHIGLKTNVVTLSRASWLKGFINNTMDRFIYEANETWLEVNRNAVS